MISDVARSGVKEWPAALATLKSGGESAPSIFKASRTTLSDSCAAGRGIQIQPNACCLLLANQDLAGA